MSPLAVDTGHQHGELLAAQPGEKVAGAQVRPNYVSEVDKRPIARVLPEAVVEAFEVVEVHHQHRGRLTGPARR